MIMMMKRPNRRPVHRQDVSSLASLVSIMDNGTRAAVQARWFPNWSSGVRGEEQSS